MRKTQQEGIITLSLTGHRPDKLAGYNLEQDYYRRLQDQLVDIIEKTLDRNPIVECHSGMALGADTVWARAIVACQQKYGKERVIFVADIPDYNQPSRWYRQNQDEWHELMRHADKVNTYQLNDGKSYAYVLNQRNIGMIKACDILIAVYNGEPKGGTANGVRDGKRMGKPVIHIDPKTV